jgi:hypothetical protein
LALMANNRLASEGIAAMERDRVIENMKYAQRYLSCRFNLVYSARMLVQHRLGCTSLFSPGNSQGRDFPGRQALVQSHWLTDLVE